MGPIKVRWKSINGTGQPRRRDCPLLLLLAVDSTELDPIRPNVAERHELEFVFVVRRNAEVEKGQLLIPIPDGRRGRQPVRSSVNNLPCATRGLSYYSNFVSGSLAAMNPDLPESLSWDPEELARLLEVRCDAASPALLKRLQRLCFIEDDRELVQATDVAEEAGGEPDFGNRNRLISVHFTGPLRAGQLLFVKVVLEEAAALRIDSHSAQGVFHYYTSAHAPLASAANYRQEQIVPCAMLHAAVRSSVILESFTASDGGRASFVHSPSQGDEPLVSPSGYRYRDLYWFTLFCPHRTRHRPDLVVRWTYPATARRRSDVGGSGNERYRQFDRQRQRLVRQVVRQLGAPGLTRSEKALAQAIYEGKGLREFAGEKGLAIKTVRNYYAGLLSHLGLTGTKLDPATRRQLILLAVGIRQEID